MSCEPDQRTVPPRKSPSRSSQHGVTGVSRWPWSPARLNHTHTAVPEPGTGRRGRHPRFSSPCEPALTMGIDRQTPPVNPCCGTGPWLEVVKRNSDVSWLRQQRPGKVYLPPVLPSSSLPHQCLDESLHGNNFSWASCVPGNSDPLGWERPSKRLKPPTLLGEKETKSLLLRQRRSRLPGKGPPGETSATGATLPPPPPKPNQWLF